MVDARLHFLSIVFVALFSTGFIFSDMALTGSSPFSFLALRFLIAFGLLLVTCLIMGVSLKFSSQQWLHIGLAGLLLQATYLGSVFWAISQGVPPGISGIIAGLQPLIALFFYVLISQKGLSPLDLLAAVLGFGGVMMIVWHKITGDAALSWPLAINLFAAVAYALGAVYTGTFVKSKSKLAEMTLQFGASVLPCFALVWIVDGGFTFTPSPLVLFALAWSTLVLSLVAIFLMLYLIDKGGAKYFSFWNFLMPAFAAFWAWLVRGETFTTLTYLGVTLVIVGLLVVNLQTLRPGKVSRRPA